MKNINYNWDELVSKAHDPHVKPEELELTGQNLKDYQWIVKTRQQLKSIFQFDQFDHQEAKLRVEHRIQSGKKGLLKLMVPRVWDKVAVVLLILLSGTLISILVNEYNQDFNYNEIVAPLGQMSQLNLSDGSKVWLNSGTTIKYPGQFNQSTRDVFIDGEAYFEVARNENKPFIVNADNFSVKVLGTSFNVMAYSDEKDANVTLVEGKVVLSSSQKSLEKELKPGQSASFNKGELVKVENVNTEFYTSWKEGLITFREEKLSEIAKKLERWYNVEVHFKDKDLEDFIFSGTVIRHKPVDQVLSSLKILDERIDFKITSKENDRSLIEIYRKKKS
nr:FecR domain-containing protein [uncultured Carboxylicivirga sp.]